MGKCKHKYELAALTLVRYAEEFKEVILEEEKLHQLYEESQEAILLLAGRRICLEGEYSRLMADYEAEKIINGDGSELTARQMRAAGVLRERQWKLVTEANSVMKILHENIDAQRLRRERFVLMQWNDSKRPARWEVSTRSLRFVQRYPRLSWLQTAQEIQELETEKPWTDMVAAIIKDNSADMKNATFSERASKLHAPHRQSRRPRTRLRKRLARRRRRRHESALRRRRLSTSFGWKSTAKFCQIWSSMQPRSCGISAQRRGGRR